MTTHCSKCKAENPDDSKFCKECGTQLIASEGKEVSLTKTLLTPIEDLTQGTLFAGRYEIIEELGKGGMGKVYKALDKDIHEEVAIKLVKPEIAANEKIIERFRNELKIARKISHENVCRTYHISKEGDTPYIIMEYVEGEDLKSLIKKKEKLPKEKVLSIAKQVCEGLAVAHKSGVVHRDLKPQNIMIDESGRAKIMDFGIARSVEAEGVTETGVIIGTPDYISPEQAEGEEADHRSDLYSLGVILYEMLTGSVPFKGDTALSIALKHKAQLPMDPRKVNPEISDDLSRLILICMEKDKERRYQSAEDLLSDLRNIEQGLPLGTKIKPRRLTFTQTLIRKKLLIPSLVSALAIVTTIAYLVFSNTGPKLVANRIAVSIFDNQTGNPAHDTIGRMAADWITQGLSQTGLVDVVPSVSVEQIYSGYEGEDPLRFLTKYTKAGILVTGTYYLQGDMIQFHVQVTDAQDGKLLKALDPLSGPLEDPTKPIDSLRQQLMTTLAHFFEPELKDWAGVMPAPSSYEAYKEFVEGFEFFHRNDMKPALDHFLRAIESDPEYAQPKLWAAQAYMNLRQNANAELLLREVEKLSDKLLPYDRYTLDLTKAWLRGDWLGAYRAQVQIAQFAPIPAEQYGAGMWAVVINRPQEAVDLITPVDPDGPGILAYWRDLTLAHHMLGDHKKELEVARRGRRHEPNNLNMLRFEARALAALGKINEVNECLDESLNMPYPPYNPGSLMIITGLELRAHGYREASFQVIERAIRWLESRPKEEAETEALRMRYAWALYVSEKWEEAQELIEELHDEYPDNIIYLGWLGALAARRGDRDEALRISEILENLDRSYLYGRHTGWRASIAALLGEKELAVRLLKEALAQGASCYLPYSFGIHPNMDFEPLYNYPPFQELMKPKG
jgi:serine/threonine protein kinase/tetratricopeptide (TPR) repeat protein